MVIVVVIDGRLGKQIMEYAQAQRLPANRIVLDSLKKDFLPKEVDAFSEEGYEEDVFSEATA